MSKKSFFIGVALVLALVSVVIVNHAYCEENPPAYNEIAEAWCEEEYGEGDYNVWFDLDVESEYGLVYFKVYKDGEFCGYAGINMDHYARLVE